MKTLVSTLFVLFFSYSFAQITVVENPKFEVIGSTGYIECRKYEGETDYVFVYKNMDYSSINTSEQFSLDEKEFESLYDLIMKGFDEKPKDRIDVRTSNDRFLLYFVRMSPVRLTIRQYPLDAEKLDISTRIGRTANLKKKHVQKLFGKR